VALKAVGDWGMMDPAMDSLDDADTCRRDTTHTLVMTCRKG
jgi:hypothetical protein